MNDYKQPFNEFVQKCIISNETLITNNNYCFEEQNLGTTSDFINAAKEFFDKKNEEFKKKNDKTRLGIKVIFDGSAFQEDALKSFVGKKDVIIEILLHCNWLMYLGSDRLHKQTEASQYYNSNADNYFKVKDEFSIGATFSGTSMDAMLFIVEMIRKIKKNLPTSTGDINKTIIEYCNKDGKNLKWDNGKNVSSDAIANVILFLCDDTLYLPIPAQNKKNAISDKLKEIKADENNHSTSITGMSEVDKNLYLIRAKLRELWKMKKTNDSKIIEKNPFWLPEVRPFWDETSPSHEGELSPDLLLEYKKALILYGPPGTGKSHTARQMAKNIIAKALMKNNDIVDCIEKLDDTCKKHIHKLQLHPNYTYDDFIVGKTIKRNNIKIEKGFMLRLLDDIKGDTLPHVLILDEINRVDLSRIFGELFTAMEPSYRRDGEGVELPMCRGMRLKVPENMYFIGTMNMIDFSLEQVDFALRRRFVWQLSTYDKVKLDDMISQKIGRIIDRNNSSGAVKNWYSFPVSFVERCTALNDVIKNYNNLGENYLIGHAFFAEIVDIFEQLPDDDVKGWEKAWNILWQISILPTLEAYCGTMDTSIQESFIDKCKKTFGLATE